MRSPKKKSPKKQDPLLTKCREFLSEKIAINTREWKEGRFVSRAQAIAVAYSQVESSVKGCLAYLDKRRKRPSRSPKKKA